jgi:mono/diheme cytochrome c family protein
MNKTIKSGAIIKTAILILFSVFLDSCNRDRNNPGWDYFPDMFYSTAYESFTKNSNFKDGMTMRVPAEGSIPRDYAPFEYTLDPESRIKAGKDLLNPVALSSGALAAGGKTYTTFCVGCHGIKGDGDGLLYTSKLYPLKPRSLSSGNSLNIEDGEIFHSITLGFGSMGAHGSQIKVTDRWNLVLYIRSLQRDSKGQLTAKKQE